MFARLLGWLLGRNKHHGIVSHEDDKHHDAHTCYAGTYGCDQPHVLTTKCLYQDSTPDLASRLQDVPKPHHELEETPFDLDELIDQTSSGRVKVWFNSPQDSPHNSPYNSPRNTSHTSPRGSPRNSSQNSPRNSSQNSPRNSSQNSPRNSSQNSPRNSSQNSPRNSSQNSPRNSSQNSPRNSSQNSPRNSSQNSPRGSPRDSSKNSLQGSPRVVTQQAPQQVLVEAKFGAVFDNPGVVERLQSVLPTKRRRKQATSKQRVDDAPTSDATTPILIMDIPRGESERKRKFCRKAALAYGLAECSNNNRRKVKKSELLSAARTACPSAGMSHRSLCSNLRRLEDRNLVKTTPQSVVLCDDFDAVRAYEELALQWRTPKKRRT